jgi:tetratricopeptide (TPR) repeat protein
MPAKAVDFYERVIRADPNFHEASARLAVNLIRSGRKAEALRVATDLVSRVPDFRFKTINGTLDISAMTILGDALRVNGDVDGAIEAYLQALQLEPDDLHSAARLVELYLIQGQPERALALEPKLDDTFNGDLKAILRLVGNQRSLLPAVTRLRLGGALDGSAA